ncbi:MAG: hypothetical protein ACOVNL_07765 [Prochlorococcaceae cyanobacterium]|jgi:hypothetical protein
MRRTLLALGAVLALSLAACQKQNTAQMEQKTESEICTQLAAVGAALEKTAALTPQSTVGQAEAANKELGNSLKALAASQKKLQELRVEDFRKQAKTFRKEVNTVTKSKKLTLEEAAAQLKAKAAPLIAAHRNLSSQVNCTAPAKP